jgi:mannuronan 5-epimerase
MNNTPKSYKKFVATFGMGLAALLAILVVLPMITAKKNDISQYYNLDKKAIAELEKPLPALPDLSGYTAEEIIKKMPTVADGVAKVEKLSESKEFLRIPVERDIESYTSRQDVTDPVWVTLEKGNFDLASLDKAISNPAYLKKVDSGYELKVPLLIMSGASLIINGSDNKLMMSTSSGAMLLSYGNLYIVDTTITSWNEDEKSATTFSDEDSFRPFIAAFSGSNNYIASSKIQSLGYNSARGYGLTFAANTMKGYVAEFEQSPPITTWLLNNQIDDLYNGLYTDEANGLVAVGNKITGSANYGANPQDKSSKLIFANNTIDKTKGRHGMLISRSVTDSFIFGNTFSNSKGSGLMISRASEKNVIANNNFTDNGGDGLFISEGPSSTLFGNKFIGNKKHGLRLRNSIDIISNGDSFMNNTQSGIYAYRANIDAERDLVLDPYEQRLTLTIGHANFDNNGKSHMNFRGPESLIMYDTTVLASPKNKIIEGELSSIEADIYTAATRKDTGLVLNLKKPLPVLLPPQTGDANADDDKN